MSMLAMDNALHMVIERAWHIGQERRELAGVVRRVLVEDVVATSQLPPFAKSLMDGYAIAASDLTSDHQVFHVVGQVNAGEVSDLKLGSREAIRIMTGAPLPKGADAVVKIEQSEQLADQRISLAGPATPGQHIMAAGAIAALGAPLVRAPRRLRPADVALIADAGCQHVSVGAVPRVAILPTGDELVHHGDEPGPGQIRNSNGPLLTALATDIDVDARELGIGRDDPESLATMIRQALPRYDMLLLSGGVSLGDRDLLPRLLPECCVTCHFHGVAMKPGKPLWFGEWSEQPGERQGESDRRCLVFGLPGNPASTFVGFQLFVRVALDVMQGLRPIGWPLITARLATPMKQNDPRPTWYPCRLDDSDQPRVTLLPWRGSADLTAMSQADGLALLPESRNYRVDELLRVLPW